MALIPFPLRAAEKGAPAPGTVPDAALEAVSEPDYRIGPGDVLSIDVLQALASAGGPDQFAKVSRIRVFRREGGKTVILPFDYDEVTVGRNLGSNILLRRGDVIVVP